MKLSEKVCANAALGVFGGTFDPPHNAHLRLAMEAIETLGLAEVVLIPAGQPLLRGSPHASPAERLMLVNQAIAGVPGLRVDASEVEATKPSFTVETLERLRQVHGAQRPLVLLLGADAFARLDHWHRWHDLFNLAHIAVANRPGVSTVGAGDTVDRVGALAKALESRRGSPSDLHTSPAGRIVLFDIPPLAISATDIRARLARNEDVSQMLPPAVLTAIHSNHLYRKPYQT